MVSYNGKRNEMWQRDKKNFFNKEWDLARINDNNGHEMRRKMNLSLCP